MSETMYTIKMINASTGKMVFRSEVMTLPQARETAGAIGQRPVKLKGYAGTEYYLGPWNCSNLIAAVVEDWEANR